MLKIFKTIILIYCAILLSACATASNYQQMLLHWQGAHVQNLMRVWGPPTAGITQPCGNVTYMYTRHQLYTTPAPIASSMNYMNVDGTPIFSSAFTGGVVGQTMSLYCNTWFEVNPQGIIVGTQFQGNGCIANTFSRWVP